MMARISVISADLHMMASSLSLFSRQALRSRISHHTSNECGFSEGYNLDAGSTNSRARLSSWRITSRSLLGASRKISSTSSAPASL
jgi:hypothetical protein